MPSRRGVFRFTDPTSDKETEEDALSRSVVLGTEPTVRPLVETTSFAIFEPKPETEELWKTPTTRRTPESLTSTQPDTTDTHRSYQTAPEISKPFKQLYNELTGSKN